MLAAIDDSLVKVGRLHGSRTRHSHAEEDALFYVQPDAWRTASARETACV